MTELQDRCAGSTPVQAARAEHIRCGQTQRASQAAKPRQTSCATGVVMHTKRSFDVGPRISSPHLQGGLHEGQPACRRHLDVLFIRIDPACRSRALAEVSAFSMQWHKQAGCLLCLCTARSAVAHSGRVVLDSDGCCGSRQRASCQLQARAAWHTTHALTAGRHLHPPVLCVGPPAIYAAGRTAEGVLVYGQQLACQLLHVAAGLQCIEQR